MVFFRSEDMSLCELVLHADTAFDCMIEIGYSRRVQFVDGVEHVPPLKRFQAEEDRCAACLRIIQQLEGQIEKHKLNIVFYPDIDKADIPQTKDLREIEDILNETLGELGRAELEIEPMQRTYLAAKEEIFVLEKADEFLTGERNTAPLMAWSESIIINVLHDETAHLRTNEEVRLGFFTGSMPVTRYLGFELMLWRVFRGNVHVRRDDAAIDIEDSEHPGEFQRKYMFIVFFVGMASREKVGKICEGFHARLFQCSYTREERSKRMLEVNRLLKQFGDVFVRSQNLRMQILGVAAADIFTWKIKMRKMLQIYMQLNKFHRMTFSESNHNLQLECWVEKNEINHVQRMLMCGARRGFRGGDYMMFPPIITPRKAKTKRMPPTKFKLVNLTRPFQLLIDAYGTPVYKEVNPAPYTVITFPFLFSVMFGDVGHGLILLLFSLYMICYQEYYLKQRILQKIPDEIWNILFGGRYILLLMGLFSIYSGLLYNVTFSKSLNIFGSHYTVNYNISTVISNEYLQLDPFQPSVYQGIPYIFGIDPVWDCGATNAITTLNSFKMKLAIVFGVLQMSFGYLLSGNNYIYRQQWLDLYYVFIPQLIFLVCLFGYLVFVIFYKWLNFGGQFEAPYNSACAPPLLIVFINMILMKGLPPTSEECNDEMFSYQGPLQYLLTVIALICIPSLLLLKPYKVWKHNKRIDLTIRNRRKRITMKSIAFSSNYNAVAGMRYDTHESTTSAGSVSGSSDPDNDAIIKRLQGHKVDLGDLFLHQGILCIESVLGAVSHTASYLRLWALSLAHDQLSAVLWTMLLRIGLAARSGTLLNGIILSCLFAAWCILTVSILVVMEGLSAFLHTLRLHWVEFQSKFYSGNGEPWRPFAFPISTAEMVLQR